MIFSASLRRLTGHKLLGLGCAALVCLSLAGCASSSKPQTAQTGRYGAAGAAPASGGFYIVQRGDTIATIARRFGWDWRALAAKNGIGPPYNIVPGQRIRFGSGIDEPASGGGRGRVAGGDRPRAPAASTAPLAKGPPSNISWGWPADGEVVARFAADGSLNKGIDIAGQPGQPVRAAASGTVIYAGSGLRGYGELLIIKHDASFLSAYGHNSRLLVAEGQQVRKGQNIAEMGATESDRVKLHFEIRAQGRPVDPTQYLPDR